MCSRSQSVEVLVPEFRDWIAYPEAAFALVNEQGRSVQRPEEFSHFLRETLTRGLPALGYTLLFCWLLLIVEVLRQISQYQGDHYFPFSLQDILSLHSYQKIILYFVIFGESLTTSNRYCKILKTNERKWHGSVWFRARVDSSIKLRGFVILICRKKGFMPQNSSTLSIYSLGENYMLFQLIYIVAKLGLADLTWNTPRAAEELAIQVNVNPDALRRVLKPLTQLGIFEQHGRDKYQLVSSYEILLRHHPDSLYHYVIVSGDIYYKAFSELLSCVQTGTTGFEQAFGKKFFTYLSEHPDIFNHFNMHMSMRVLPLAEVLLATYNFLAYHHIVDIGGGNGQFLSLLLQKYPHLRATLFDLPATCEQAEVTFQQANLSERCTTYSGDFFFDSLPEGGDLYMLSHILHDWGDEHALRILQNCARTMASNSKIILIEYILHEYQPTAIASIMDLFMLVVIGGRERTARQFRELLARAGFQITSIIPIPGYPSVIEAIPLSASLP